jgi:hypothetical protein
MDVDDIVDDVMSLSWRCWRSGGGGGGDWQR